MIVLVWGDGRRVFVLGARTRQHGLAVVIDPVAPQTLLRLADRFDEAGLRCAVIHTSPLFRDDPRTIWRHDPMHLTRSVKLLRQGRTVVLPVPFSLVGSSPAPIVTAARTMAQLAGSDIIWLRRVAQCWRVRCFVGRRRPRGS